MTCNSLRNTLCTLLGQQLNKDSQAFNLGFQQVCSVCVCSFATANPDPIGRTPTYMDHGASPGPVNHSHTYSIYQTM